MTADAPRICRRCGFTNVPGDQFCGSCGAFLEWEGEQVASQPPVAAGTERPADPGPAGTQAYPAADLDPVPATALDPAGALVRCPACGIANAAGRTFCQACGTRLAEAGRVASVSRDQIVDAVNRPVTVTTTTIRPSRTEPQPAGGGGGFLKWIAIMAVLGLAVGAAVVLGGNLLRGEGPGSAATAAPSASPVAEATAEPSGSTAESPGASGGEATPAPTPRPKAEELALLGASASSVVGNSDRFQPTNVIDGDRETCWQEGSGTEKGEWIEVVFAPSKVTAIVIRNGYNASRPLYKANHRLKDIEIRVGDANPVEVRLKDTGEPQKIDVKNVSGAVAVRITILSVYRSVETSVEGSPFDDAALDEITVMGFPGG